MMVVLVSFFRSFRTRKSLSQIETDLDYSGLNSDHVGLLIVEQTNP